VAIAEFYQEPGIPLIYAGRFFPREKVDHDSPRALREFLVTLFWTAKSQPANSPIFYRGACKGGVRGAVDQATALQSADVAIAALLREKNARSHAKGGVATVDRNVTGLVKQSHNGAGRGPLLLDFGFVPSPPGGLVPVSGQFCSEVSVMNSRNTQPFFSFPACPAMMMIRIMKGMVESLGRGVRINDGVALKLQYGPERAHDHTETKRLGS
jgi:hypothetical protein